MESPALSANDAELDDDDVFFGPVTVAEKCVQRINGVIDQVGMSRHNNLNTFHLILF